MKRGRKRLRLVPARAVECFEVRLALYMTEDGESVVSYEISDEHDARLQPPLTEVLGVLEFGKHVIMEQYH